MKPRKSGVAGRSRRMFLAILASGMAGVMVAGHSSGEAGVKPESSIPKGTPLSVRIHPLAVPRSHDVKDS